MKRIIINTLKFLGLKISRISSYIPPDGLLLERHHQPIFEDAITLIRPFSMISRQRLSTLFEFVQYIRDYKITGTIVECGVWKGGAVGMMAIACKHFADLRELHLFDAFDDICEPDANVDGERAIRESGGLVNAQGRLQPIKGIYDKCGGHGTINICKNLLEKKIKYPSEKIHFHKGWFQETMIDNVPEIKEIAILRLDADWYESTRISLDTLYDRVSPNGVVIVDDYGAYDGCRKAVDEFLKRKNIQIFRNHVDEECIYWFKSN